MSKCVNKNHPDFLQLVEETGINPIVLSAKMGVWMEKNDTDEWPSAQQLGIIGKPILSPIDFIFNQTPELIRIGTQAQYSEYLATIFPDSEVRDIVYHGSKENIETFKERDGIHFGDYSAATGLIGEKFAIFDNEIDSALKDKKIFLNPSLLNISKLERSKDVGTNWNSLNKDGVDGISYYAVEGGESYAVFNPNQIYRLGSSQDIQGFKRFITTIDPLTKSRIDQQISNLKDTFAKVGVSVEVSANENINESARVQTGQIDTSEINIGEPSIDYDQYESDKYPIFIQGEYAGYVSLTKRLGYDKLPTDKIGFISGSIGGAGIELEEKFRGKGYGTKVYIAIAKQLAKEGITLKSEFYGKDEIGQKANNVWKSLISKGYAIDRGKYYEVVVNPKLKSKIEFNPNKLREDSIFHEHGHILVDLVADRDFINSGIDQLRGTKLWNDITILYSEYDDTQLGKEVLTTAIGLNARDQFNDAQLSQWKFWWNRFIDRLTDVLKKLGINVEKPSPVESKNYVQPIAIELARQLTSGNITTKLNLSLIIHNNKLKDVKTTKFIKDFEKYLTVRKNGLKTIFQKYGSTGSTAYVKRATERYEELELIDSINENNFHSAIQVGMKQLDNDVIDVAALENKLNELKLNYLDKDVQLKDLSVKDRTTFFEAMRGTSIFLQGYTAIKNFGTLNEQDIATLPESDKAKYKEMSDFVFEKQTELLPRIAALESTYDSLKPLHLEWQLQYTTNPKILESTLDLADILNELTYDESKLQLLFDSAVYSNDPLLANMAKMVHLEQGLSEDEADLLKRKYLSARAKLKEYKDTELADKIYDENGQLVQQYDRIRFFRDLEQHLSTFKAGSKAYEKARIEFYKTNTKFKTKEDGTKYTIEEIQTIATKKKEELNTADYTRWLNKQFKYSRFTDLEGYYKYTSDFIIPVASYTNTKYSDIQNNKELGNYYNAIKEVMTEATSAYHYSPQSDGYLPNVVDKAKRYGSEHDEQVDMVDEDGNTLYHIPIKYTGLANAKPTIGFRKRLTGEDYNDYENDILRTLERRGKIKAGQFKSIKEIYAYNKTIEEENKKAHGEAASRKLDTVIPLFIDSAMQYKHRKAIEDGLLLSLAQLREQRVKKLDYKGRTKKQKGVDLANNPLDATFSGVESNTYRHAAAFMKMVFYDKYVDKKTGDEALRILKEYTSILGMGFNIFAAVKNVTMGGYMTTAESMAGLHFTPADLNAGSQRYLGSKLSYWSDTSRKDQSSSTLENALIKRFKVIESYDNQFELQDAEISKSFAKRMYIDAAFFLQHEGEHMMQNTTMFTMLESHRLIDGKAISYQDYLNGKLKVLSPKMDKAAADAILASNEEIRKTAKEKFDSYPQMKELYELSEDGHAQIKAEYVDKFTKEDEVLFREEIKGVNHKIHGIYNKSHKGTANQSMLWQSVLQFRNWVRPGWNKRFGTRGGVFTDQQFWNENRNEIDTGSYSNLMKFLAKPITQNSKTNWSNEEERTAFVALQNILKDYGDMMVNMKYYWHQMSDTEKAAAKSAITELAVLAALMLLSNLLRGLLKDKDWAKKNRYTNFLLYQLSASVTEMWTFIPVYGWFMEGSKILTNPNATYGFALNTLKLTSAALQYPFIDDEKRYFQGGVNNKKLKVGVYASRDLPMLNVWQRIMQLDTQTKAYNMFGAVGGSSNN